MMMHSKPRELKLNNFLIKELKERLIGIYKLNGEIIMFKNEWWIAVEIGMSLDEAYEEGYTNGWQEGSNCCYEMNKQ